MIPDDLLARRAGYATVDEWVAALDDVAYELALANATEDERERIEFERSKRAHDRLYQRMRTWGMAK